MSDTVVDSFSDILDVGAVQTGHGDSSISEEIDVPLLDHSLALRLVQPSETEHTDLRGNVVPVSWSVQSLELSL